MFFSKFSRRPIVLLLGLLLLLASPQISYAQEQPASPAPQGEPHPPAGAAAAEEPTFPALLVSDIHFDPFHDPGKVQQLAGANVSRWDSILSGPPSPNQQQAFAELQQKCDARGIDTPYTLFHSALRAMRARQPKAKFITVSGDLIAHAFSCRYSALFPGSIPAQMSVGETRVSFAPEFQSACWNRRDAWGPVSSSCWPPIRPSARRIW